MMKNSSLVNSILQKNLLEELFCTLLRQLMTGEVRTADLRGFMDFADYNQSHLPNPRNPRNPRNLRNQRHQRFRQW